MGRLLPALVVLLACPARAAAPCDAVEEVTRRACEAARPHERRGSEPFVFDEELCQAAAAVARRACERGVHAERYGGTCARQAEYVGDVLAEACRHVLYRNPRAFVKAGFKAYDERCQRHARAAEERALEQQCAAGGSPAVRGSAAPR